MRQVQDRVVKRLRIELGRAPTDVEVGVEMGKELIDQGLKPR